MAPASATKGNSMIASAWYAGWHMLIQDPAFSLSQVSWNKYSQLNYAFARTTGDVRVVSLNGSSPEVLPQFVSIAHANGVKAKVSVGGWTGSRFWSSNVATPQNRTLFVKTLVDLYPGASELRADPIGSKLILSAATSITPFIDSDGNPSDVSGFSEVLDYIAIMVYDLGGPWSSAVEANAPLNDSCAPSAYQNGSAISAVHAWNAAGMPMDQISDAFTDGCSQTQLALYVPFNVSDAPVGDSWDGAAGPDECGFLKSKGLGGFSMWEAGGDSGDILLDSIRESAGY
ncbi:glycoside hydrolase superfamily [Mycena olivaceomarginata]|nr:glycoside hydrolase superfamily [Mycena olivaceomarginata]